MEKFNAAKEKPAKTAIPALSLLQATRTLAKAL